MTDADRLDFLEHHIRELPHTDITVNDDGHFVIEVEGCEKSTFIAKDFRKVIDMSAEGCWPLDEPSS